MLFLLLHMAQHSKLSPVANAHKALITFGEVTVATIFEKLRKCAKRCWWTSQRVKCENFQTPF